MDNLNCAFDGIFNAFLTDVQHVVLPNDCTAQNKIQQSWRQLFTESLPAFQFHSRSTILMHAKTATLTAL